MKQLTLILLSLAFILSCKETKKQENEEIIIFKEEKSLGLKTPVFKPNEEQETQYIIKGKEYYDSLYATKEEMQTEEYYKGINDLLEYVLDENDFPESYNLENFVIGEKYTQEDIELFFGKPTELYINGYEKIGLRTQYIYANEKKDTMYLSIIFINGRLIEYDVYASGINFFENQIMIGDKKNSIFDLSDKYEVKEYLDQSDTIIYIEHKSYFPTATVYIKQNKINNVNFSAYP